MTKLHQKSRLRPFIPAIGGITVGVLMLGLLNAQLLATYIHLWTTPQATASTSSAVSTQPPAQPERVSPEPRIIIDRVQVNAPVIYDMDLVDEPSVQRALQAGTLQFADTALPGQKGNVVIVGHSSNVPWAPGDYKFVFALLDRLQPGDVIYLHFESIRYEYKVTGSKVVSPYDVSVLEQTTEPTLTLITCTPVGTSQNRLVVTATQVSPDPTTATERQSPGTLELQKNQPLPGR